MTEIIHKELSYKIVGVLYDIYNKRILRGFH